MTIYETTIEFYTYKHLVKDTDERRDINIGLVGI